MSQPWCRWPSRGKNREAEALVPAAEPEPDPEPRPAPLPRPRAKRKVIAFPRQASEAPAITYRLADPVVPEQPRILDVPEELEAFPGTPLLDGLQFLASAQPASTAPADHIELPFQAVSIPQRLYAGLVDCAIVAAAAGVFGAVGYKMLPKLVLTKPVVLTAAAVPVLLWAIYQYVLTVYGGVTAGMRVAENLSEHFQGNTSHLAPPAQPGYWAVLLDGIASYGIVLGAGRRRRAVLARPHQPDLSDQPGVAAPVKTAPDKRMPPETWL